MPSFAARHYVVGGRQANVGSVPISLDLGELPCLLASEEWCLPWAVNGDFAHGQEKSRELVPVMYASY